MTKYHRQFLKYLADWQGNLPVLSIRDTAPIPHQAAIFSVDLVNGFCTEGPLSSPRVQAIVPAVISLLTNAHTYGIRYMVFAQDTHTPDAKEFGAFPPHCVRGTGESETIPELKQLPFFPEIDILEKNSIQSGFNTGLQDWMDKHPEIDTFIIAGDCTDLCVYQIAMHFRLDANARQLDRRVIVPVDCVDTYDLPVETAFRIGAMPHDGELLHSVFLYHMALNGIEIVRSIQFR